MGRLKQSQFPVLAAIFLVATISVVTAHDVPTTDAPRARVPVPPLIIDHPPKSLAFREGESFQMLCVASGDPEPEYRWEFNSEPFDPSGLDGRVNIQPGVGSLVFHDPLKRDEGLYQCFAENKYGAATSVKVVLRRGDLQAFRDKNPITHRPDLGSSLALVCNPPVSYPPAEITWTIVSETQSRPVDFDDRISQDPVGNLNFVNVLKEDAQGGAGYACEIWNDVMRRQQRGSFQMIAPKSGVPQRYPPTSMWRDPTTQTALRGETWRVKCIFAGNPTPRVTWIREGADMPPRKREESFGQEMVIEDVQFEDQGSYECEGNNMETSIPVTQQFKLTVKSAPYWIDRPESVSAAENEEATFKCAASGVPDPVIAWFINGKPILKVPEDPRRKVDGGIITFKNLTIQDAMVYQCNASNTNGYIFANAYLNVQSEPPTILEPPREEKVAEGKTIKLPCKVYGSPKPLVVWSKGNEQLTGGNFKVLDDGGLEITKVSLVDAGEYTCTATNKWDTARASGTLVVRRKTRIQTGPMDVMVYENTEVKFTCTATTDAEEIANLQIVWKKNGKKVDFKLAQRMFRNDMDNSLTISGTMSLDTAAYSCMATNGLDEDEVTAQLIVQGVPDPIEKIIVNCTKNVTHPKATIEWQPAKENYAPILNFVIQYNTTFAPDQWVNIADNISQNVKTMTFDLSPWANYTFRVLARNKIGLSDPGIISSTICQTEPANPTRNPDNVIGEGDEPDNLVIFWTPIAPIDQNGKDFTYLIKWQQDVEGAKEEKMLIKGAPYYHHIVPDPQPTYQRYRITVQSKNYKGWGPDPKHVIGYSGENAPRIKVNDVKVVEGSLTSTSVILEWTPIKDDPSSIRGFFRGYRVEYGVKGGSSDSFREVDHIINEPANYPRPRPKDDRVKRDLWRQTTTPIPIVRVTLNKLRPSSTIVIQVRILNKYYAGLPSTPMEITTPEGEPGPPGSFEVVRKGPTHFDLAWNAPLQRNGRLLGYNISYQTITGLNLGRLQYREADVMPTETSARLTALKPDTYYRIFLSASTAAGKGEPMFLDAKTSHAGAPNPPTFGFVGDVGETYVDLKWTPSRSNNPGSVFYVQYRARGEYEWHHTRDEALSFTLRISGLDPGTTYQMRVIAKNGQGLESAAEWQEVTTGGIAPGGMDLGRSMWFYGIFISMILIVLLMVGFMFAKRARDSWWEEEEREREIQLLRQLENVKQLELENQAASRGSADMGGPGVAYSDEEGTDAESEDAKSEDEQPPPEEAPPLPAKVDAFAAPVDPTDPVTQYAENPVYGDYRDGDYDYSQYPEGSYPEGAYPEGAYSEGQYEGYYGAGGQYYEGYDDGSGYYDQADGRQYEGYPNDAHGGQVHLETDGHTGGSYAV